MLRMTWPRSTAFISSIVMVLLAASGLEVTHRRGQGLELGAPGRRRDHRTHDELGEADGDEALDQLAQRRQPHRRELERSRTPGGHHARGGRVEGRTRVADAHAEVLAADRAPGPGRPTTLRAAAAPAGARA